MLLSPLKTVKKKKTCNGLGGQQQRQSLSSEQHSLE